MVPVRRVTSLRIRPEGGEEDYWSLEILGGASWEDGTVISLTLDGRNGGTVPAGRQK